jgi:hypothetical protein
MHRLHNDETPCLKQSVKAIWRIFFLTFTKTSLSLHPKNVHSIYIHHSKSTLTMDKNLLQKAKAPMIALIQTKNIIYSKRL